MPGAHARSHEDALVQRIADKVNALFLTGQEWDPATSASVWQPWYTFVGVQLAASCATRCSRWRVM
jgi:hypothetical protein